jgi:hypothetical protein
MPVKTTEKKSGLQGFIALQLGKKVLKSATSVSMKNQIQKLNPFVSPYSQNYFKIKGEYDLELEDKKKLQFDFFPPNLNFLEKFITKEKMNLLHDSVRITEVDNILDKSRTETREDGHRKLFILEIGKLIGKAERHNAKKQHIPLINCTNIIGYLAIYMKEFTIAVKVYSICAEMLMVQQHWKEAAAIYFKVACCVKTAGMS